MGFSRLTVVAVISCLFCAATMESVYSIETQKKTADFHLGQTPEELSLNSLRALSRAITVKIIAGDGWGSGIIMGRQGQSYTVLTNAHVLRIGNNYQIQTPDGKIYRGQISRAINFNDDDLGLLTFKSSRNYAIASIAKTPLAIGDATFAAGFPNDSKTWVFTAGKVEYLLPKSFQGGYQVGYSNDVLKGMSGGPVINRRGELVAINGRHKFPLWGNPFIFTDGSTPLPEVRTRFAEFSWAVPVQKFLQRTPQIVQGEVQPSAQLLEPTIPVDLQSPNGSGWSW